MTTFIAASVLVLLFLGIGVLLEHTHRRTAGLPHPPWGAGSDHDVERVLHDLDVTRASR